MHVIVNPFHVRNFASLIASLSMKFITSRSSCCAHCNPQIEHLQTVTDLHFSVAGVRVRAIVSTTVFYLAFGSIPAQLNTPGKLTDPRLG